ncbi:hypothetical protein [Endozoicomonas sp.]|uniref:hypothetical protein n=1 Tax=Endozoicomonas sp. TaxID=1892382 RepID=UPI00383AB4BE
MKDDKTILLSKRVQVLLADCQALLAMYKPNDWSGFDDIAYQEEFEQVQKELELVLSICANE